VAVVVEPEPVAAEPEPVATEPEPVAAVADDAAAPLAIEPPVAAEAQPEPAVPAIAAASVVEAAGDGAEPSRDDVVAQPTSPQRAPTPAADVAAPAPDAPAAPQPAPWLTVAPEESDSPQWPVARAFPASGSRREMPMTLAGRPLLPQADPSGLWAASAREVLTAAAQAPTPTAAPAPTAQPCVSCGLSLSANARFCRRCGTRQA